MFLQNAKYKTRNFSVHTFMYFLIFYKCYEKSGNLKTFLTSKETEEFKYSIFFSSITQSQLVPIYLFNLSLIVRTHNVTLSQFTTIVVHDFPYL